MKPEDRAWAAACELYDSPGFRNAYLRGARAALAGRPATACPYKPPKQKSWRAAWRAAWLRGYRSMV